MPRRSTSLDEAETASFLGMPNVLNLATFANDGSIHLVPMWFALTSTGAIGMAAYAKSQKVRNLQRNRQCTALIEDGDTYGSLRGLEIVGTADISNDRDLVRQIVRGIAGRYTAVATGSNGDDAVEAMARGRVALVLNAQRLVSWDHRKLPGGPRG